LHGSFFLFFSSTWREKQERRTPANKIPGALFLKSIAYEKNRENVCCVTHTREKPEKGHNGPTRSTIIGAFSNVNLRA